MRSIRDIAKDEEITFNYVEIGDPTETRRRYCANSLPCRVRHVSNEVNPGSVMPLCSELMENFFFHCTCPRCQANLPEVTLAPTGTTDIAPAA